MAVFLNSQDAASLLDLDDYIEAVESAYRQHGRGDATMLPRVRLDAKGVPGFLKMLPAALGEPGVAGVHVYSVSGVGTFTKLILLFDVPTGDLRAVIESDRLGWLVPGAASAVATKWLARKDARIMGILGSGRQARSQLLAVSRVRDLELVKVYSPTREHRDRFCSEMGDLVGCEVAPVAAAEWAVRGSEILSVATTSATPVFDGSWVEPGAHINAIGAHHPDRREIDTVCVQRSKLFVDSRERALQEEGGLLIPLTAGRLGPKAAFGELGEVIGGTREGRTEEGEITLFFSGAVSVEYASVAARLCEKAEKRGIGQELAAEKDPSVARSLYVKKRKKLG